VHPVYTLYIFTSFTARSPALAGSYHHPHLAFRQRRIRLAGVFARKPVGMLKRPNLFKRHNPPANRHIITGLSGNSNKGFLRGRRYFSACISGLSCKIREKAWHDWNIHAGIK
jgi:hypothetical protein